MISKWILSLLYLLLCAPKANKSMKNLLKGSDVTRSKTSSSSSLKLSLQETRVEKDEAGARPGLGLPLPANR